MPDSLIPYVKTAQLLLDFCISRGTLITYQECANIIGFPTFSKHFIQVLGEIQKIDDANKNPLRCAIVISKGTGFPSEGFYECARSHGNIIKDEKAFWLLQIKLLGIKHTPVQPLFS